jgi:hypothetical protein
MYDREEAADRPDFLHQIAKATKVFSEKSKTLEGRDFWKNCSNFLSTDKYFFQVFSDNAAASNSAKASSHNGEFSSGANGQFCARNLRTNLA